MAEAVVSFAAKWIGDLMIQEAKLLYGVRGQVEDMLTELRQLRCFLKDADARQDENETLRNLVVEIREVAYYAENVIATFIFKVAPRERRGGGGAVRRILMRSASIFFSEPIARHKIGLEIITIKSKITGLKESLRSYGPIALTQEDRDYARERRPLQFRRTYSHVAAEEDCVGLEKDIETLVKQLVVSEEEEKAKHNRVVSICGMGGLGKTTLARKVYHHPDVKRHFEAFAWVSISQQWQLKDILQRILTKLIPEEKNDIVIMIEDDLVKLLFEVQQQKKCLVVLDDIWSSDAWVSLSPAFPQVNTSSKIILTSRNKNVAELVDPRGFLHEPKCLSKEQSWKLFERKAFPKSGDFKVELMMEKLGMEMVEQCGGLPLAIVVLGGLLASNLTLIHWRTVHQNIGSYLKKGKYVEGGQDGRIFHVLALSYQDLPYHLKTCFLYLGNYPEDSEIKVKTLYQLWMAEGFLSQEERGEEETMMDVAERYMGELAQRCMVQVTLQLEHKYSVTRERRGFRHCRLHDLMRDLCLLKVKEENFLKVSDQRWHREEQVDPFSSSMETSIGSGGTINSSKIHRLAIYLDKNSNFRLFEQEEKARHIRTVLFFNGDDFNYPIGEQLISFSKDSKFLRVIHFEGRGYDKIVGPKELPKEIGNLILLRYLSLRWSELTKLSSSIGNLRHLQTLDLRTMYPITVPNVLWKMEGLVHLYLPDFELLTEGKLRVDGLSKLETLENLKSDKVDVRDLFTLTNLRRLTKEIINLEDLAVVNDYLLNNNRLQYTSIKIRNCEIYSENGLSILRQLLGCDCLVRLNIYGIIGKFPEYEHHFCPSLTYLYLKKSQLKDDSIATLEKLPNLRILYLQHNSFVGKEMVFSAHGFPRLETLRLSELEIEEWRVDDGAMQTLSLLEIISNKNLKMLPDGLRFISTLQTLVTWSMPKAFNDRLRVVDGEEGEDFQKFRHIPSIDILAEKN